jgi:hypothetical protein
VQGERKRQTNKQDMPYQNKRGKADDEVKTNRGVSVGWLVCASGILTKIGDCSTVPDTLSECRTVGTHGRHNIPPPPTKEMDF